MSGESHEGWANRETWAVSLWINNDQGWQESVFEAVREARDSDPDPQGITAGMANRAGNVIKENVEQVLYGDELGQTDHLNPTIMNALYDIGSLWRVDWDEIGANFLTALDEGQS